MKKIPAFLMLFLFPVLVATAQSVSVKQKTDALNRVILDSSGQRINYSEPFLIQGQVRQESVKFTKNPENAGKSMPLCLPRWFQGTMGSCIGVNSMISADIDNDGKTEIICSAGSGFGSGIYWYVMEYNAMQQSYDQTWMSPPIDWNSWDELNTCIRAFDTDNDNVYEIYTGNGTGNISIYRGSDMELVSAFSIGAGSVNDIIFADADNDGQKELVICNDSETFLFSLPGYSLESTIPYGSFRFAAGNVDADPRIEICYSGGTIVDYNGTSAQVEWNIYSPTISFAEIGLTDTDNDGMEEVIIAKPWYYIEVYDADIMAPKGIINTDIDIDALLLADVNNDGREEILYGDGQWGDVYCFNSQTLIEMWSIPNPEHGVTEINIADADDDGSLEVLWGAGCSSTGSDYLFIHKVADQSFEFQSKDINGPFSDVETGDVDGDGQPEIVTISFSSEQGYDSGILSIFDGATHNPEWQCDGNFFPFAWEGIRAMKLADINGDSRKEIIVATDYLYDGMMYVVDGQTHQIISSHDFSSSGIGGFLALDAADVDNDGAIEYIATGSNNLFVITPGTYGLEFTSPSLSGSSMHSVMTGDIDSDPNPEMVVCNGYITVYDGVTHEQWISADPDYSNMDLYDWDNDGKAEIIGCTNNGGIRMIDRQVNTTEPLQQFEGLAIEGIRIVNLDNTGLPEFVFTANGRIFFANASGDILSTENFGEYAGSYDALKIADVNQDQVREIYAGTEYQVVEVSEECSQCLGFKVQASETPASCVPGNDGTANTTVTAGTAPFEFLWSNGMTQQNISGLTPGIYWVRVTDNAGCPAFDTVVIGQSAINAGISGQSVGCKGIMDGWASINVMSGTPPYQYNWNNGATQDTIKGLSPGNYSCVVTDAMGCTQAHEITITKDTLVIDLLTENPECFGMFGSAYVQVTSGTPPFEYKWNGVPGYSSNWNLVAGEYFLIVKDTLFCIATRSFTLTSPPELVLTTSFITDDTLTAFPDGQATVNVTGGTPPYYYQWNDPYHQTSSTAISLENGHYQVTVTDYAGCQEYADVFVYYLGVNDKGDPGCFSLYPNPASSIVNAEITAGQPVTGTLKLEDLYGVVLSEVSFDRVTTGKYTFSLRDLPQGIFFMVLQTNNYVVSRKLIISR